MPHFPGHRRPQAWQSSRLQGLLGKGQGRGLFGPNLPPGGVPLGGRMNLIGGGGPTSAINAGKSFTGRIAAPTSTAVAPRTFRTKGAKVSDIFKDAKIGQFGSRPAAPSPLGGYGQFGPQQAAPPTAPGAPTVGQGMEAGVAGASQFLARQGGGPSGAAAPGGSAGGMMNINPGLRQLSEDTKAGLVAEQGPQGFLGKVGGFFKRAGAKPGMGQSLMSAGAAMMSGRDPQGRAITDPFASIGAGLQAGMGAYEGLKEGRRVQSDWEEDERRREEINAGIDAAIKEQVAEDGTILRRALNDEEAAMVRAAGGAEGVTLAASLRQGTRARTAIDTFSLGADDDYLELLRAYDDETALALVTDYAKTEDAEAGRVAHLVKMGYSREVAEVAAQDAAGAQAVLNRGMETTIMRDGRGILRIFHDGEFVGSAGEGANEGLTEAEAATLAAQQESLLWDQTGEARAELTRNYEVVKEEVNNFMPIYNTIEAINQEEIEDYFGPTAKFNATIDRWMGLEKGAMIDKVNQMLTTFGIAKLTQFSGAISEIELLTALQNAGDITQVKPMLNAILMNAMDQTVSLADDQHNRATNLDRMLGDTASGRAAAAAGMPGQFWSSQNAFGFDLEGLNQKREEAGAFGKDILDDIIENRGDAIFIDPQTGGDADPDADPELVGGQGVTGAGVRIPHYRTRPR
jgi:hypothetical protein